MILWVIGDNVVEKDAFHCKHFDIDEQYDEETGDETVYYMCLIHGDCNYLYCDASECEDYEDGW